MHLWAFPGNLPDKGSMALWSLGAAFPRDMGEGTSGTTRQEPAAPSSLVHGESCVHSCVLSCALSQSCVLSCALSHVQHCALSPWVVTRCEQTGSAGVARPMASVTHSAPSPAALGDGMGEDMSLGPHGTRVTGSDMCQTLSPSRWPHAQLCQSFSDISCPGVYFKGM